MLLNIYDTIKSTMLLNLLNVWSYWIYDAIKCFGSAAVDMYIDHGALSLSLSL